MLLEVPGVMPFAVMVTVLFGLVMGSFLNCLAWRMTHGESVLRGRSHCTSCGHVLGPRDLVPVMSWLFSRGRCRYCGERVSWRYPATELLMAVVYVSILLCYGFTLQTVELMGFASVLLVLSLTDLDDYIIPNATIVAAIAIRLAYIAVVGVTGTGDAIVLLRDSVVGGFAIAVPLLLITLVMDYVLGRESFGGGDLKLLFVAGMYFGWQQCLFLLVLSCVLGIVFGMLGRRSETTQEGEGSSRLIPFGPSIAAACWVTMLVGESIVRWYLGFLIR